MIEEAYCSHEVAKLLKKNGFHIPVHSHYTKVGSVWHCEDREDFNKETKIECYSRPTHQLAMRWLREVHNFHIDVDPSEGNWNPTVIELENWSSVVEDDSGLSIYDTYEEAVEESLKYCLKNLIDGNNKILM